MTKIVLSTFAFLFALGGAIATNVSNAAEIVSTRVATIGSCVTIGTCTIVGNPPPVCVTFNGSTLYSTSSTCSTIARGQFTPL